LAIALLAGIGVALIARFGRRDVTAGDTFLITLVMLCVLIALVTQVVGGNVARAFSLVGALSIVRFRTIVRDTQDTAFVMLAVVAGMGIGAGYFLVTCIGMAIVWIAVAIARFTPLLSLPHVIESRVTLRVGLAAKPEELLSEIFARFLERQTLASAETVRQGTALTLSYRVRLKPGVEPVAFLSELNRLSGVESVEWDERAGEG
jgi:hypothetical protein